ncbi:hypothetical protein BT93_E2226 [Corymbia citriodora subsp. variegata]|nr:hypothetical protein BT93_E2226 [Corymbia citriodora subsp. variegata]
MVGGMLLHLRSLRKFEHSGGWIKALLEEAENERMHLAFRAAHITTALFFLTRSYEDALEFDARAILLSSP